MLAGTLVVAGSAGIVGVQALAPSNSGVLQQAHAVSKAAKNKKAHIVFKKKARSLGKTYQNVQYKFVDLTGDGIHEMLVDGRSGQGGGHIFYVYTYKSGKAKRILKDGQYGMAFIKSYRKTKAFVMYCTGHGHEHYDYFAMKNGRYKRIAKRWRSGVNGGSVGSGAWSYSNGKSKAYTKATFNKKVKKLTKGKTKKVSAFGWTGV